MPVLLDSPPRLLLRDLVDADRPAFLAYQMDRRYLALYGFSESDFDRPNRLFDRFLAWQAEDPRRRFQLGLFASRDGRLLGCAGLRMIDESVAAFGLELAPDEWGRFRVAVDAAAALLRYGFETLNLQTVVGATASGNRRVEKLARWFGAEIAADRQGPPWMQTRGWREVDWAVSRRTWKDRSR